MAYQAARVPGPDRIYFDLYGARLEPGLNGKSVEVIDDGFLKRIRAAQFSNNVTRIVLDVSSVSDYSAFLLPNPWRLIIDIHGLKPGTSPTTNLASAPPAAPHAPEPQSLTTSSPAQPPVANPPQPAAVASAAAGTALRHPGDRSAWANSRIASRPPTIPPLDLSQPRWPEPFRRRSPTTGHWLRPRRLHQPAPVTSRSRKKPSPLHPAAPALRMR